MWIVVGIVVVAVVLMVLAGRNNEAKSGRTVEAVTAEGLRLVPRAGGRPAPSAESALDSPQPPTDEPVDHDVDWSAIFEITVVTRRELRRTWFGFEIRTESHGLVMLDGSRGPGQAFLAESHRFAGFKHIELSEALKRTGSRAVCYSR
ncbi:MAG: hypothetical protein ACR2QK_23520 [Acidimicrobiales bacterium]